LNPGSFLSSISESVAEYADGNLDDAIEMIEGFAEKILLI